MRVPGNRYCPIEDGAENKHVPDTEVTTFTVGRVQAHCTVCGGTQFARSGRRFAEDGSQRMTCIGCGADYMRNALMNQIAREINQRADVALKKAHYLGGKVVVARPYIDVLLNHLDEAEELLKRPHAQGHLQAAVKFLNVIAQDGPTFHIRATALNASVVASLEGPASPLENDLEVLLSEIRLALEQAKRP